LVREDVQGLGRGGEIYTMAIGVGVPLRIAIRGRIEGQAFQNVGWWYTDGAAFLTATATGVGEAFWNDIKTVWRAAMRQSTALVTESILVSEPGPTGAFGEYAIPVAEREGTRSAASGAFLPSFNAAGIRLVVATRTTRPGQKRIVGGLEEDQSGGGWLPGYLALLNALAPKFAEPIILGAPVATGVLIPYIVRTNADGSAVLASQEVTGWVTNTNVTSQVSRKIGRGI
jgi:hypothetical protein